MVDRGTIAVGNHADLVVFPPAVLGRRRFVGRGMLSGSPRVDRGLSGRTAGG
jgi:cytosine/adenosine deaminase-related metal-dependent hydrolase